MNDPQINAFAIYKVLKNVSLDIAQHLQFVLPKIERGEQIEVYILEEAKSHTAIMLYQLSLVIGLTDKQLASEIKALCQKIKQM